MAVSPNALAESRLLNVNVGVLGHVDSGKTSLVAALSTTLSTAALDKSPQSKSRRVTLDLGLSAFTLPMPDALQLGASRAGCDTGTLRCTLVDCPGHANLIRTIIGGASIIDIAILVVDVTKGFQAQTAECLVIAEICCKDLVVALNKVDVLPEDARAATVERARAIVLKTLEKTRFAGAPIIATAAAPSGVRWSVQEEKPGEAAPAVAASTAKPKDDGAAGAGEGEEPQAEMGEAGEAVSPFQPIGIQELLDALRATMHMPYRHYDFPFLYAIDHCFSLRGRGTILAGTVLQGSVAPGDEIEIVHLRQTRRVRSLEIFKKPVQAAYQGDRVALNVPSLDSNKVERGIACAPGIVLHLRAAVVLLRKVRHHKRDLESGRKLHVTIGHLTVMGTFYYFGAVELALQYAGGESAMERGTALDAGGISGAAAVDVPTEILYDWERPYEYSSALLEAREVRSQVADAAAAQALAEAPEPATKKRPPLHWAFVQFDSPVPCPAHSVLIASRLDLDGDTGGSSNCRIAAYGRVVEGVPTPGSDPGGRDSARSTGGPMLPRLYKWKTRTGVVARVTSGGRRGGDGFEPVTEYIVSGMFANGAAVMGFLNCVVITGRGVLGRLVAAYGTAGEARVHPIGVSPGCSPPAPDRGAQVYAGDSVFLRFKKFTKIGGKLPHVPPPREFFQGSSPVVYQDDDSKLLPLDLRQSDDIPAEVVQYLRADRPERKQKEGASEGNSALRSEAASAADRSPAAKAESSDSSGGVVAREVRTGTISTFKGSQDEEYVLAIVQAAFSPAEDIRAFVGSPVLLKKHEENYSKDLEGALEGPFAKSGKCKVRLPSVSGAQLGDEVEIRLIDEEHQEHHS